MFATTVIVRDSDRVTAEVLAPDFVGVTIHRGDRIDQLNLDLPVAREIAKAIDAYDQAIAYELTETARKLLNASH